MNKKHQEYIVKSTKVNSDDRDQIRLKLQEYYKQKTKVDEYQNEDFATGPKSNHTSQIENEIQDHIEILGIEQNDLLASAPMLQPQPVVQISSDESQNASFGDQLLLTRNKEESAG